jgi:hypothetical protein
MPRYYLDIVIGTRRIPCQDGYELPNPKLLTTKRVEKSAPS